MNNWKNLNWTEHQADPDNWLKIPEFNIQPQSVNFEGFAWPILGPSAHDFYWKVPIFDSVHAVRNEARSRFATLADLKQSYISAIMSKSFMRGAFGEEPLNWSGEQLFSWRHECFFHHITNAVCYFKNEKSKSMGQLALAMSYALDLYGSRPLDERTMKAARSEMAKAGALARLEKDPVQLAKAEAFKCWQLWKEDRSRYKGPTAFARDMIDKYPSLTDVEVIRRWCRTWEAEEGSTTQPAK